MESLALEIAVILCLMAANGVFAMSEIAVVSARRPKLQQRADEGHLGARLALDLAESPNRFLSTIQVGITTVGIFAGVFGGATIAETLQARLGLISWMAPYAGPVAYAIVVAAISYISLVIGELVPKRIGLTHSEPIAMAVAPVMMSLARIGSPIVSLLTFSTDIVLGFFGVASRGAAPVTEEEVKILIEEGTRVGVFEPTEQRMVERVLRLDDLSISALMTPRPEVIWLDPEDPADDIHREIAATGHSHYPVATGRIDQIIGLVKAKDLLAQHICSRPLDLKAVLRPAEFVPETTSALNVLERFKEKRVHAAVVIDEHGDFQGIVTTSDILEAIVGDIPLADEPVEADIVVREDGSWLVDGKVLADDLKELLHTDLPLAREHAYQTLGGMVMAVLGRVPASGEHFVWNGYRFEVVDMDGHRVDKVLIAPVAPCPNPPDRP